MSFNSRRRILLIAATIAVADCASAPHALALDQCRLYGFAPHTRDYALCRLNLRRYWTTGPCGSASFAALHREYCHLNLPPFI